MPVLVPQKSMPALFGAKFIGLPFEKRYEVVVDEAWIPLEYGCQVTCHDDAGVRAGRGWRRHHLKNCFANAGGDAGPTVTSATVQGFEAMNPELGEPTCSPIDRLVKPIF